MGYIKCFNDNGSECYGYLENENNCFPDSGTDSNDELIARLEQQENNFSGLEEDD